MIFYITWQYWKEPGARSNLYVIKILRTDLYFWLKAWRELTPMNSRSSLTWNPWSTKLLREIILFFSNLDQHFFPVLHHILESAKQEMTS